MSGAKRSGLADKVDQATTTALAPTRSTVMTIFNDERLRGQLQAAARNTGLQAERLLVVALNELRRNPQLMACTRESFVAALMGAARLGLEVGGPLGHFYLVPFRDNSRGTTEVTPILGYKGMITLARRGGEIKDLVARPVYENDAFDFAYGVEADVLRHVPAEGDRGVATRYYGIARFTNGGSFVHVMTKAEVDKFRGRSRASSSGPWVTDYDAMACKTVIRRMAAFLPLSVESATAIAEDEEREEGRAPEIIDLGDLEPKNGASAGGVGGPVDVTVGEQGPEARVKVGAATGEPRQGTEVPLGQVAEISSESNPQTDPAAPGSILRDPEPPAPVEEPKAEAAAPAAEAAKPPPNSTDPGAAFRR